jgi:AraC-like DNA-binding protein
LQKIFAEHGSEISEALSSARIERAAELVLVAPRRIEIGKRFGYGHENHFARAFERRVGVSPSVLRRALCARDRYERTRVKPPPESARSLNAQHARMRKDADLVNCVCRQLAAAA